VFDVGAPWAGMGGTANSLKTIVAKSIDDQMYFLFQISAVCCQIENADVSLSALDRIRHSDPYFIVIDPYGISFQWNLGG
jgi:hypothetical protein